MLMVLLMYENGHGFPNSFLSNVSASIRANHVYRNCNQITEKYYLYYTIVYRFYTQNITVSFNKNNIILNEIPYFQVASLFYDDAKYIYRGIV